MMNKKATKTAHYFRALMTVLLLASTLALVMTLGVSAGKAEAGTAVTKEFSTFNAMQLPSGAVVGNCSAGPTQGAASPYPAHFQLSQSNAFHKGSRILDVEITLKNLTHTFPDDVDVLLVHGTQTRTVLSDVGGSSDVSNVTMRLDDEASSFLPLDGQLVSGVFKPTNQNTAGTTDDQFPTPAPTLCNSSPILSGFDGMRANGGWDLYVVDDASGDCGAFGSGWSLKITAK